MNENTKSAQMKDILVLIATCITGLCAIITTILSISFYIEKNKLEHDYETLRIANSDLQTQINHLSDAYDDLVAENANIQDWCFALNSKVDLLERNTSEYEALNNNTQDIFIQIIYEAIRIRSAPDSSSEIIGIALQGEKYLLLDTVTDTNGREWCQVLVGDETGYIRSDLVMIVE